MMQEKSGSISPFKPSSPLAYPAILLARTGLPLVRFGTPGTLFSDEANGIHPACENARMDCM